MIKAQHVPGILSDARPSICLIMPPLIVPPGQLPLQVPRTNFFVQVSSEALHYEIWEYCQGTSKVQAQVLQNLRVR